jgi:hypothetical protein
MTFKTLFGAALIAASLTFGGHDAAAQSSTPAPFQMGNDLVCPDGSLRPNVGPLASDLAMRMLCMVPAGEAAQNHQRVELAVEKAREEDQLHAAITGQSGIWEGLKASWKLGSFDFLEGLLMAHLQWAIYAMLLIAIVFRSQKQR